MNNKMKMISRSTLITVAVFGGAISASLGVFSEIFQRRIRNTKTYKRALEKLYNHEEAVKLLGQPIKEGRVTFKNNNSNNNSRQFSVNLKGSNTKAKLNCKIIINELDRKTELTKLEIKFNNIPDKVLVIHEI